MSAAVRILLWATGSAALLVPALAVAQRSAPAPATVPAATRFTTSLPVDQEAMQEALAADRESTYYTASSQALLHYLVGSLAADRGDHAEAVEQYRQTLALDEDATHVRVRLGGEYWRLGLGERAESTLRLAVADDPKSAEAHQALGIVLLQADRLDEAARELQKSIALDPARVEAYRALAEAYRQLGDESKLASCLDAWAKNAPGDQLGWRDLGLRFLEAHDLARAERYLNRALTFVPEDPATLAALGQLADLHHQDDQALAYYERSIRSDPDDGKALFELGRHHLRRAARLKDASLDRAAATACFNSFVSEADEEASARADVGLAYAQAHLMTEAIEQLDAAVTADPANPHWHYYRGMLQLQLGHAKEAIPDLALVPVTDEAFVDAQVRLGLALDLAGKLKEAVASLTAALEQRPTAESLYAALARVQRDRGHGAAAIALLERVVEQQGPGSEVVVALVEAYEALGRRGDGLRLLRRTLEARPEDQSLLSELALQLGRDGQTDSAVVQMRKILQLDPRNAEAMNFIGFELAERGTKLAEAEELTKAAIDLEPDNGLFTDSLGWVYYKEGKLRLAIEALRRASSQSPGVPVILEHLGDTYARSGDAREAARSYASALQALGHSPDPERQATLEAKLRELKARRASIGPGGP
jgi:tetratricopeptide (TPR) repeat protein